MTGDRQEGSPFLATKTTKGSRDVSRHCSNDIVAESYFVEHHDRCCFLIASDNSDGSAPFCENAVLASMSGDNPEKSSLR